MTSQRWCSDPAGAGRGSPATVVLVRHGQTPLTPVHAYSGSGVPGPDLTEDGRAEALQAAGLIRRIGADLLPTLPRPDELRVSPMLRTRQTAEIIGSALRLEPQVDSRAKEADFGQWEGLTEEQIEQRWPGELRRWHTSGSTQPPGGESMRQVGERTQALLAELALTRAGRATVVVAHAVSIRSMVGQCLLMPAGAWWRLRLPAASVSVVDLHPDGLCRVHAAGWPAGLL